MDSNFDPQPPGRLTIILAQITIQDTKVYRNGRQQARIEILVEATRDDVDAHLTPREEANMYLFDYEKQDGVIPYAQDEDYEGWQAQRENRGYDFYPDVVDRRNADAIPSKRYYFYVSANEKAKRSLRVAIGIVGDDGSVSRTNGWVTRNDTGSEYLSGLDQMTDNLVEQIPPAVYSAQNFVLERSPLKPSRWLTIWPLSTAGLSLWTAVRHLWTGNRDTNPVFDDLVRISIVPPGGQILPIREMHCEPAGVIHWKNSLPATKNPCFTGYVSPDDPRTIHWNEDVATGSHPLPELASAETYKGALVLCGRPDIPFYTGAPEGVVSVTLVDAYGSEQRCLIGFVKDTRDELEVKSSVT